VGYRGGNYEFGGKYVRIETAIDEWWVAGWRWNDG